MNSPYNSSQPENSTPSSNTINPNHQAVYQSPSQSSGPTVGLTCGQWFVVLGLAVSLLALLSAGMITFVQPIHEILLQMAMNQL